jgi:hypothetical protein
MEKIKKDELILYVILLFYAAMDGWRDAWLLHDWWPRHIAKWIAFYPLPIYVLWQQGYLKMSNWKNLLWLAAGGFFFWEVFYTVLQ